MKPLTSCTSMATTPSSSAAATTPMIRTSSPPSGAGISSDVSPDNILDKAKQIRSAAKRTGIRVAALAPNARYDDTEHILKLFKGALAIDPDRPPLIRIDAPRHDRNKPYWPQFLEARAGYAKLTELARAHGVKVTYEIHTGTPLRHRFPDARTPARPGPQPHRRHLRRAKHDRKWASKIRAWDSSCSAPTWPTAMSATACPSPPARPPLAIQPGAGAAPASQKESPDIPQLIDDLKAVGYKGALSLELFIPENFVPGNDDEIVKTEGAFLRKLIDRT